MKKERGLRDMLSERVYTGLRHKFTEPELKQKILEAWQEISLTEIRASISCWKKRLNLVIEQDGDHIDTLSSLCHHRFFIFDMLMLRIAW